MSDFKLKDFERYIGPSFIVRPLACSFLGSEAVGFTRLFLHDTADFKITIEVNQPVEGNYQVDCYLGDDLGIAIFNKQGLDDYWGLLRNGLIYDLSEDVVARLELFYQTIDESCLMVYSNPKGIEIELNTCYESINKLNLTKTIGSINYIQTINYENQVIDFLKGLNNSSILTHNVVEGKSFLNKGSQRDPSEPTATF